MPRPKTITLGGEPWKYKRLKEVWFKGERVDGTYDFSTNTIEVDRGLTDAAEMETDIHEIDHVMHGESEPKVIMKSKEKTTALRKLGYRKLTPEQLKLLGIE